MPILAIVKLIAGLILAYVIMQVISRAHMELVEERPWPQHITSALILVSAPALAMGLLLAPLGGTLSAVRIAAFGALGIAHLAISGRGVEEARQAGRTFTLLAGGTLLILLLSLLR
ncbi:MAG: hypothetical protein AAFW01_03010 [Pseudomonadota bacterium]